MKSNPAVLILGAGINGAALARELALNGVPVIVVDTRDLAAGTTAYSSRLIHGGLRYLEYGDFDLVRESLGERTRWLRLAPHLVRPLRLFIPIENRWGGFAAAVRNFLGLRRRRLAARTSRGLTTVRAGLWLYDRYARDRSLPPHAIRRLDGVAPPAFDRGKYRWACSFFDAQLCYPERFTLELLLDAQCNARQAGVEFRLFTYHRVLRRRAHCEIVPLYGDSPVVDLKPAAIVNATGAWVDYTLAEIGVASQRLIGGTKGSHFVTYQPSLVESLAGDGIYAEASDGRPVFILPFGDGALVGTTDEPFSGDPDTARASPGELRYLIDAVNQVFPQVNLAESDVEVSYSGVRPLPASGPATPAAITRKHWLHEHRGTETPCFSIVGGKLTTCRSLAESAAHTILERLGRQYVATSRDRPLPGSVPSGESRGRDTDEHALAARFSLSVQSIAAVRSLYGERAASVLNAAFAADTVPRDRAALLDGTPYPIALARYMIEHEWVRRLDDFVERRLMLLYHRRLTRSCLEELADLLVEAKIIGADSQCAEVESTVERLRDRFGKRLVSDAPVVR